MLLRQNHHAFSYEELNKIKSFTQNFSFRFRSNLLMTLSLGNFWRVSYFEILTFREKQWHVKNK